MQYRKFGSLDFKASALGFGAMRLPVIDGDSGNIDKEKAKSMIRYAVDNGVNYIDTAWPYHDGKSEAFIDEVLKDGYREKVKVATKLPSWEIKEYSDMDRILNEQLQRLEIEQIDFYLLHALNKEHWKNYKKLDVFSWIDKIKEEGKIKYIGFSFHDDLKSFKQIIDDYDDWDFCQIQYNYLNTDYQAGRKGLKYAAARGLGVIIMEPLLGGKLAGEQPPKIQNIFDKDNKERTAVDRALQWLWNQKEVSLVLSGMSTMGQVKENVESADNSGVDTLSRNELEIIKKAAGIYEKLSPIACTGCNYCMPCPNGVRIPLNFSLYNEAKIYDKKEEITKRYYSFGPDMAADKCVACGLCEPKCPQNLEIIEDLKTVKDFFEKTN